MNAHSVTIYEGGAIMKISVVMTEEDYIAFNLFHAFHSPLIKKQFRQLRLFPFLMTAVLITVFYIMDMRRDLLIIDAVFLCLLNLFYFAYYPKIYKKSIRKNILKTKKEGKLLYPPEYALDFKEDGFIMNAPNKTANYAYSDITEICEENDVLYIYIGAQEAFVIPHHCLEHKDDLIAFLREKKASAHP